VNGTSVDYAYSLLQSALDSTEDGILVVSLQGQIIFYNRRLVEIWRIQEELINKQGNPPAMPGD